MNSHKLDMSMYNSIARTAGAIDGIPPAPQNIVNGDGGGSYPDIQQVRSSPRVDMNLYESVTGIKPVKNTAATNRTRNILLEAREALINCDWTDDESIRSLCPSLADALGLIIGKIK